MQTFTGVAGNAVNVTGGVATVPTGAAIITCPASCMTPSSPTYGTPVTTPGTGTIAVATVNIPAGSVAGSLTSNWQNNSSSVPIFNGANSVQCGDGLTPPGAATADPSPCSIAVVDHNLRTPYVTTWTLGVQHALTNNLSMDIAYVGNHGTKLNGIRDINQPPLGAAYCLNSPLTAAQIADPNACPPGVTPSHGYGPDAWCKTPCRTSPSFRTSDLSWFFRTYMIPTTTACRPHCNSGLRMDSRSWPPTRILIPWTMIPTTSVNFFRRTAPIQRPSTRAVTSI